MHFGAGALTLAQSAVCIHETIRMPSLKDRCALKGWNSTPIGLQYLALLQCPFFLLGAVMTGAAPPTGWVSG